MTPGLAGFIAAGDDARARDEVVAGVLGALGAAFGVIPDRGGKPAACRRTWLDTFDWRLHRAGLTLEYAGRARGGELLLSGDTARAANAAGTADAAARPSVVTVPGFKVTAIDTVGAGDTFVGALAVALAAGVPPVDAVTAAAAAGAAAAARPGTQPGMPRPADVGDVTGHRWPVTAR